MPLRKTHYGSLLPKKIEDYGDTFDKENIAKKYLDMVNKIKRKNINSNYKGWRQLLGVKDNYNAVTD